MPSRRLSLKYVNVLCKIPSTSAVSGKLLFPLSTKLYTSARFVVMMPYLAPCASCNKDHFTGGSFSIHCSKFLILGPFFLFVPGGSILDKSHSPTGSESSPCAAATCAAATCTATA